MKPIGKYIVVKNIDEEIVTESGLVLSGEDANQMRYKKATVVAPGTEVSDIKVDDVVYYDKGRSFTMVIDEAHCTIIREGDVVVVL
jgi:co-chaperonin GroES (HSP10)